MSNVVPIRDGITKDEKEFCQKIDDLVAKFNRIAAEEIIFPEGQITGIASIDALQEAMEAASDLFYKNLTKTTMPKKIADLKEVFGEIADLGMEALRDLEIHGEEYIGAAINRLIHVLDIMNDDASEFAPELVRTDEIYNDPQWSGLREHRDEISDQLREHLDALHKREFALTML